MGINGSFVHTDGTSASKISFKFWFVVYQAAFFQNYVSVLPSMNVIGPLAQCTFNLEKKKIF